MTRFCALVLATICLQTGCGAAAEADFEKNHQSLLRAHDEDGIPAVVGVGVARSIVCSGTVIGPRTVLTAAHCLADFTPDGVFVGADPRIDGRWFDVASLTIDPSFDYATLTDDVASITLAEPLDLDPAPLSPEVDSGNEAGSDATGRDEAVIENAEVLLVGFGVDTLDATVAVRRKRSGNAKISKTDARSFEVMGDPTAACLTDSGGAVFSSTTPPRLIGVISAGDAACAGHMRAMRVDAVRTFIDGSVPMSPTPSSRSCAWSQRGRFDEPSAGLVACLVATAALRRARSRNGRSRRAAQ